MADEPRKGARAVRLPLQIGLGGLGQTTRYAALLWTSPALLIVATAGLDPGSIDSALLRLLWTFVFGVAGVFALAFTVEAADNAKRDRPADILLDSSGLTVQGGSEDGRRLKWGEVDAAACCVLDGEPRKAVRWLVLSWLTLRRVPWLVRRAQAAVHELRLPLSAGGDVLLAEAEGDEELASLEALRDSIRSTAAPHAGDAKAELWPELLRCPRCGAPQVPVDRDSAPCPYCGTSVPMPEALREKERAAAELRGADKVEARIVQQLIDQPGAANANRLLWLGRKFLIWIQPVAVVFLCILAAHQTGDVTPSDKVTEVWVERIAPGDDPVIFYDMGLMVLMLAGGFGIVWTALAAYFANRKTLRVLAQSFGAVPPKAPGAPSTCRQCGAPLPDSGGAAFVRCVYCQAENVLGVDPRPAAARTHTERSDLRQALGHRRRARLRVAVTMPVCALAGAAMLHEAAVTWRIPKLGKLDSFWMWRSGTIANADWVRRSLTVRDGSEVVRVTVFPRGTIGWDCKEHCTLEAGGRRLSARSLKDVSSLAIVHGVLRAVPSTQGGRP
jgi:uncharacterized Zn finger protein (UPF0148 family)